MLSTMDVRPRNVEVVRLQLDVASLPVIPPNARQSIGPVDRRFDRVEDEEAEALAVIGNEVQTERFGRMGRIRRVCDLVRNGEPVRLDRLMWV